MPHALREPSDRQSRTVQAPAAADGELSALLRKLTLEQKVRLLTGADLWSTRAEPAIGLRAMVLSDGPSGVRGSAFDERRPSLNLPSPSALAAAWEPALAYRVGAALAAEAQGKGVDVVLGPTLNLHRSPLGGRHFEAFSEDPVLSGALAAAYVRGLQDHGVAATPKHYVANDSETERMTVSVEVTERALRELYLMPFERAVEAGAWAVMSAYNSVHGVRMTEHDLLDTPLCTEWGFDGAIVSDWTAVRSTEPAALSQQVLAMPGPDGPWDDALVTAVREGRVPEAAVDEKVIRLLRLAARVGALDSVPPPTAPPASPTDGAFAREVAASGAVLLRNAGELPWGTPGPGSIAVIGEHAARPRTQGGGSASVQPPYVVSPLEGIRTAFPDANVVFSRGVPVQDTLVPLPVELLSDPETGEPGLRARFLDADGRELLSENRRATQLVWLESLPTGAATLELRYLYHPEQTETVRLGVGCPGHVRMRVDDRDVIDTVLVPRAGSLGTPLFEPPTTTAPVRAFADTPVAVTVTWTLPAPLVARGILGITVGIESPPEDAESGIAAAVEAAAAAEVAVVVVGTSPQVESESFDRESLALPGAQDALVRAVAQANPRTVVVINAGSPVLTPWRDDVAAVLLTWFGGQETGHALADILSGAREPGGRLPTTWPASSDDVPVLGTAPTNGVLRYAEGIHIGYRAWLRSGARPAYPFGHGLGYTTWELTDLRVHGSGEHEVEVTVTARNTGPRRGAHVVQAYLSREASQVERPVRWLAAFARIEAAPGTEQRVRLSIPARAFAHWDNGWSTEPGAFTLHIGSHIDDLPLEVAVAR